MERTEQDKVLIEAPDGRRAGVVLADYRAKPIDVEGNTYEVLGWRIVSWVDGAPYAEPDEPDEPAPEAPSVPRRARTGA